MERRSPSIEDTVRKDSEHLQQELCISSHHRHRLRVQPQHQSKTLFRFLDAFIVFQADRVKTSERRMVMAHLFPELRLPITRRENNNAKSRPEWYDNPQHTRTCISLAFTPRFSDSSLLLSNRMRVITDIAVVLATLCSERMQARHTGLPQEQLRAQE